MNAGARRHKACNSCRERKTGCDGAQPKCRRCERSDVACVYGPAPKRYSKAELASMLDRLTTRLGQAERFALQQSLPPTEPQSTFSILNRPALNARQLADATPSLDWGCDNMFQFGTATTAMDIVPSYNTGAVETLDSTSGYGTISPVDAGSFEQAIPDWIGTTYAIGTNAAEDFLRGADFNSDQSFTHAHDTSFAVLPSTQTRSSSAQLSTCSTFSCSPSANSNVQQAHPSSSVKSPALRWDSAVESVSDHNLRSPPSFSPCSSGSRRTIGHGAAFQGIEQLQGCENYLTWSRAFRGAARKEGIWDMFTGTCKRPDPPATDSSTAFERFNDDSVYWNNKVELALGGLESTLSSSLSCSLQSLMDNAECPRNLWLELERQFKPNDAQKIFEALQELQNISAARSGGVQNLADVVWRVQEKLQRLTSGAPLPEWYFVAKFLLTLGPGFEEFVKSTLDIALDLSVDDHRLSFEEVRRRAVAEEHCPMKPNR